MKREPVPQGDTESLAEAGHSKASQRPALLSRPTRQGGNIPKDALLAPTVSCYCTLPRDSECKKPLAAVSKMTERGNWVCFGPGEAYIENVATGKRTKMDLQNGTYSLDVEYFVTQGFSRQDSR